MENTFQSTCRLSGRGIYVNTLQVDISNWNTSPITLLPLLESKDTNFLNLEEYVKMAGGTQPSSSGDLAIIGTVLNAKQFEIKGSQKVLWELSDLKNTQLRVMVKGHSTTELNLMEEGTLWAILNPQLREKDPQYDTRMADVYDMTNLMKIGLVTGLVQCKGLTAKGSNCKNIIYSVAYGEYCKYHVSQATKKKNRASTKTQSISNQNLKKFKTSHVNPPARKIDLNPNLSTAHITTAPNHTKAGVTPSLALQPTDNNRKQPSVKPFNEIFAEDYSPLQNTNVNKKFPGLKDLVKRAELSRTDTIHTHLPAKHSHESVQKKSTMESIQNKQQHENIQRKHTHEDIHHKFTIENIQFKQKNNIPQSYTEAKILYKHKENTLQRHTRENSNNFKEIKHKAIQEKSENLSNKENISTNRSPIIIWGMRLSILMKSKDKSDYEKLSKELLKFQNMGTEFDTNELKMIDLEFICKKLFTHVNEEVAISSLKCYRWAISTGKSKISKVEPGNQADSSSNTPDNQSETQSIVNSTKKNQSQSNIVSQAGINQLQRINEKSTSNNQLQLSNEKLVIYNSTRQLIIEKYSNSFNKDIENQAVNDNLLKRMEEAIQQKSSIDSFREEEDAQELRSQMLNLEKLDATEEFKSTIKSVEIQAFYCEQCKLWMDKVNPDCVNHNIRRAQCLKEFWECLTPACGRRFFSLNHQKPKLCPNCRHSTAFAKPVSMYRERKCEPLDSEKLLLISEDKL